MPGGGLFGRLWQSPYLLLALTNLFWAGNFVIGRAVHGTVPPVALAFFRWTGGFLIVIGFAWPHLKRDLPVIRASRPILLAFGLFGIGCYNTMVYLGLNTTTAINALLLQSVMPLAIILCTFLFFRERAGPMQWLGILVSLAGVAAIAGRGSLATLLELSPNRGDAWVLAAVVSYAIYSALLRRRPAMHPLSFIAVTFALGATMLLPLYVWESIKVRTLDVGIPALLAIGYVSLFPSLLAYLCFNRGVELLGPNRAGQSVHLMPAFGSILAITFLGESIHAFHAVGVALIAAGIALATLAQRR